MIQETSHYQIIHDRARILCFVGNTRYNKMLFNYWSGKRPSILVTVEDIENNSQEWFDQHQFICAVSNVNFKYEAVTRLAKFNPHYFTVIGIGNVFGNVKIGQGTFIQHYNTATCDHIVIGNYCTISSYITFSHNSNISDFCHISAYSFINYTNLGEGSLLAIRCTLLGQPDQSINIAPHCNFMASSTVRKDVAESATYYDHKRVSTETSLTYKIL